MRARSRARKLALQALYQAWFNPSPSQRLIDQFHLQHRRLAPGQMDWELFGELVRGALVEGEASDAAIAPHLSCRLDQLDPTERQLLRMAAYELNHHAESPTLSVIDDAVHLAKSFGATDSYKLVNAVLDKLVRSLPQRATDLSGQNPTS